MSLFYKNCVKSSLLSEIGAFLSQKQYFFAVLGIFLFSQNLFAEGTKQLAPTSDDRVYIQPAPNGFGYYDGPEDLRLKINIANPNQEQVFLGFSRPTTSAVYPCSGSLRNAYFRIKDPNGNVVFPTPGSNNGQILDGANSNISTYAQAVAGPSPIAGSSGYTPYIFNPDGLPAGDYYIEFSTGMSAPGSSTVNIELFDITVATEGANPSPIDGRVHSQIWSMYAPRIQCNCGDPTYGCFDRPFNGKFNVYTPADSVVVEVDFANSGLQPAFFNVFFNSYGTANTGDVTIDRQSLNSQQVFATEYEIFLNDPDPTVYPSGTFGTYAEEPIYHTCNGMSGMNGAAAEFFATVTKPGQIEVLIDLHNTGDFLYTPNTEDVILAIKIEPEAGQLPPYIGVLEWDGLDGLGNPVDLEMELTYRMKYSQAVIHFPIYDSEYMLNGFNVQTVRPTPPPSAFDVFLYYDDSNIPDATGNGSPKINLDGCTSPCHTWTNFNYGNVNTINTFFFGSEERIFTEEPSVCIAQAVDDVDSTTINVPVVIDVVGNDLGTNLDPTSVNTTGLMPPSNGTISINPVTGEITYTPNPGFVGVDMFEYEICDANGMICSTATVTVTVTEPTTETDCTDGIDNDGDGLIDCDDPDCENSTDCENPVIGIAKNNVSTVNNGDGTYTVSFLFTVENFGNVDLSDLVIFDDIVGQFAGMNPINFATQNGTLTANTNWNGTATSNILNANQTLTVGATGTVSISFDITPGATSTTENEATAEGTSPEGEVAMDTSTDGTDPDGDDGDNDPDENTPTVVEFKEMPVIGVAKNNASTINNGDGTYNVSFDFVIENFGDVNLSNLTLFDDIIGQFAGMNPTNFATQNGTLTANTNWDGTAGSNILNAGQSLNIGQNGTVSISFTITPGSVTMVNNTAIAGGTTPAGITVTDTSTTGTDPDGNDGDNDPDENDPTVVDLEENPSIGVAKNTAGVINNGDGTYNVSFDFVIENFGDVNLTNLTLFDDIIGQFTGMSPTDFMATTGTLTANTGWNGTATSNILAPGQSLNVGAIGTVSVSFTITPGTATSVLNTAIGGGTTPAGNPVTDDSTSGTDPDGDDDDNDPDENTPTTVPFDENPSFTVVKADPTFVPVGGDVYTLTYEFALENTGDIQLNNVEIFDDVLNQFSNYNPTNFTANDGSFIANNNWNGNATSNILQNGQSLAVGATGTVSISFDATLPNEVTLMNLVNVSTTTPSSMVVPGNDTNVYEFTPPFCPELSLTLGDDEICGNEETNMAFTADANAGEIGIFYTIDNQLTTNELYAAGHGGATLLTTVANSTTDINTVLSSGILENNGTAAVTYYIYAILNDGNPNISPSCNVVAMDEITVNPSPNAVATVGGPYCEGESVQLFITGTQAEETFLWTGPNGYTSMEQNPVITAVTTDNDGDYSAVVTNAFGCTFTTNTLDVVIDEMPAPPTVSNNSPTCADGQNDVVLTATTTANGTINWYKDANTTPIGTGATLTLNNVTTADAGNYYAIIDNGLCPSDASATTEVIIDELPTGQTAMTGDDMTVCNGQSNVNLSANNPNIGSGMWSQNATNPAGAVIANPNDPNTAVTNLTAGTYIFTWSLSNGACENYSTNDMTITVSAALESPTISGDTDVCEGETLTLMASNAPAGTSYEWTGPNGFAATTQTISINAVTSNNSGNYSVRLTNADGCFSPFSMPANVTVFSQPATPIITGNEICDGENIELQTNSTGNLFEWFSPANANTPAATTNTNSVSIPASNAGYQAGNWTVVVTDENGCQSDVSNPYNVVINDAPNAPTANYNDPVCEGQDLQLMATTIAGATYSWTGPNSYSSFEQNPTITNSTMAAAGTYEVVAIVDGCASEAATVNVTIGQNIIISPTNNGGACGDDLELYANASGGVGQLSYLWNGPNDFFSTDENPVIPNPTAANEGVYTVMVMDDLGCSSEATLNVTLGGNTVFQPEIASNAPLCEGENLTLSTAQYNGQSVSYEWTGPNGTSTSNGDYPNASTIIIENATATNAGNYTVFVNVDGCGSNTSAPHSVTINNTPIANASTNFNGNCVDGQTDITLLANASNGNFPYTYIWNGPNGFTSNAANPTISNATEANSGTYTVRVTDSNGCQAEISTLDLTLSNQPATPMIASPQMACFGEKVELSVTNADPSVTYSWAFNGTAISNNNSSTFIIDPATDADSGTYEVTATKADCTPVNTTVELTVSTTLTAMVADQDFGCTDGANNVTIVSDVNGGIAPYTYAWTGPNGFTSTQAMPTIAGANADDAGTYNVVVTDDNGCTSGVISAVISIKDALDQPVFEPLNNAPCEGEQVILEIQQYNGANVTYNWSLNGNTINNNSNVLIINNATTANNGTYEVSVTADGCSTPTSANFNLTVNEAIEATVANQNLTCISNNTDLTLSANITSGTAPFSYEWSGPNGFTSNAASPVISNVKSENAGTYQVIITDNNGCQSAAVTAVIQITEAPNAPNLTSTGNVCEDGEVTLSTQSYAGSNVVYNWTKNGQTITNNSNVLNLNPATTDDAGDYVVSVTVDGCTAAPSNVVNVEIFDNPTITIAAVDAQNCTDGTKSVTLDATPAGGSGIYTYTWSGPNGFTSTDEDPILNNINASMAGNYTVQIFDNNGCQGATATVSVAITDAPDQPQLMSSNPNACEGDEVILSVAAATGANVTYTWSLNGTVLSNTANSLAINNINADDAGDYEVTAIVDGCTATSEIFTQTVFAQPALTIFPVNDLNCADGTTDIIIQTEVSTGTAPYSFLWTGPNGFTSFEQNPTITGATADDAGNYQVTFEDANGCISTTESVTINITDGIDQPTILTSNGAVCEGESLTLSTEPYSGANVTYQWFKDGNPIQNNDMPTLSFAAVSAADNGDYNLTVTVDGCANFANTFNLNINDTPSVAAISSVNGNSLECADGTEDIQLIATITGGTAPFTYSWTGPNGFASTLQVPNIAGATEADAGTYQVMITDANNCGSETATVELNITDGIVQPQIMANNASGNTNTCEGEDLTLTVDSYTGSDVTYAWTLNGAAIANNTNELTIQNAMAADAGDYEVTVTVDGCSSTSTPYTVEIFGTPMIDIADLPDLICSNGSQNLTVDATITNGSGNYSYAWTGPNGFQSQNEDLNFQNATSENNGTYTLIATDATGCVSESASVQISVQDGINQPIISATGPVCEGGTVMLEVTEYQGQSVNYEWTLNGETLPIEGHQYAIQNATIADAGDYQVTVFVNNCSSTADIFTLNIFDSPAVSIAAVDEIPCADGTEDITLTTSVTGGIAPYVYAWEGPNGFTSTVASPTLSNVSSLQSGTYTVTVTDENNCGTDAVSVEVVIGNGIDQPIISSNTGNVCEGESTQLSVQNYTGSNVTFEWYLNNNLLLTNTNQHFINAASSADAGDYRVVVMVNDCEASSEEFNLEIYNSPQVSIAAVAPIECSDGTLDVTLQTTISAGTAPFTYEWSGPNGFVSTVENPTLIDVTEADAGTYLLSVTDANNCAAATASVDVVISDGLNQPTITSSTGPTCPGENITLMVAEYTGSNVTYEWFFNNNSIGNNSNILNLSVVTPANSGDYSVSVTVDGCSGMSAAFTQTVFSQPSANIADVAPVNCADGTTSATIDLTPQGGNGIYNYSWTGPNGFTSTTQDLIFNNVTSDDAGTYTVVVTDANNCESAPASVVLEVNDSFEQPILTSTGATCEGESATLSVDPVAGANVTYLWFKNGNLISNNGNELVLNSVNTSDAGDYQVEVTADGCSSTSNILTLEIFEKSEIVVEEVPTFACTDGTEDLTFNIAISGSQPPYTFSWTGPNGFVSTEFTPTIENVTAADGGTYIVQAMDGNGCATDPVSIAVEISDVLSQPSIASNGNAFCEGEEITLSTTVYQGGNVTYNWTRDGISLNINNPNLIINSATAADGGDYRVQVTVGDCSNTSAVLAIEVQEKPTFGLNDAPTFACTDGTEDYTFSVAFSGDQVPYTFSWTGPNGFNSMEFAPTLENISASDAGTYTLIVTDGNGCASDPASVEIVVNDNIAQPTITSSGATCEGEQLTLSTTTYQGTNVTYNWTKDGSPLNINNPQIVINSASESDSGDYQVEVTVNDCSNTSAIVSVEVSEKPTVFFAPLSPINCADNNETVTLMPTIFGGSGGNTFAWTGPNGFTSTLQNPVIQATAANSGAYTVIVTSNAGCASDAESVEVLVTEAPDQPTISSNGAACEGEELVLSTQEYQGSNVSYNWTLNGNPISNNSHELIIPSATAANNGTYAVTVTVDGCSNTSNGAQISISEKPTVEVTSSATAFCTSGMDSLTLFTNITGGVAPFTYEWVGPNGFFSVNANPVLQNVNDDMDGSYTVFITDGNGCQANAYTIEIDIEEGITEPVITSTGQSCNGDEFTLSVPPYSGQNVTYEWSTPNGITQNISGLNSNEITINPTTTAHEGIYTITVTVDGCTNTSDEFNFTILDEPTANPSVATTAATCEGGNLELLSNATGNGTLTYEWSGPNGFTSNVPNPTINDVDDSYDGQYLLIVTNQQGCSTTATLMVDNIILPAPPTPTIVANTPICNGEDLILSTGTAGEMYEWISPLGDDPATLQLPGLTTATGSTTILSSYEAYVAGNWGVRVQGTNGCWSEISAPVAVEFNEMPQAIATNGGAICAGGDAQLFANNITNATYEWYIAGENTIISTQANPVIGNVTEDTVFELLVTLNGCSSEAASTLVTVLTAPEAQPEAAYFLNSDCSPSDLQLFANVTTAGDFEFNWIGPNGFTSNLENPVIVNADEAANGVYELTIINGNGCSATYATNAVSVIPDEVAQPIISMSNAACEGETLILTTTQYEGAEVDYVWLLGTTIIANSNNNQLIINEVTTDDEGDYTVNVQVDGCVLSSNILTVNLLQQPETAPTYVLGGGNCEGGTLQLFANVNNVSGNETYAWTGPNGFTSNAPEPYIAETTANNNGAYSLTVTNPNGCSTTQSVTVFEIGDIPATPVASSNSPVCEGGEIMLAVPQPAPGMPIYVWYNGLGQVIGNGQILTIMEDAPDAISPYSVKLVADGCESDLSDPISVTTESLATPTLSTDDDVLCEGQPLILNTTSAASNNATYTWYLDDELQGTTTNPTFIINPATTANSGIYTVQVNVPGCQSGLSNAINVSVFGATATPTTANSTNANSPACNGSVVMLTTPFISGATYTWYGPNGYTSTNFSPVLTDVSAANAGDYFVVVEVEGCASAVSETTTVFVQPALPTTMVTNDGPYCVGDSATLSILNPISFSPTDTVTYEWFNAETMTSIGTTDTTFIGIANIDATATGNYYVIMTLNGCAANASDSTFVNVAELPQNGEADAGEDVEICASTSAELNAVLPINATGLWTSPTGATIDNPTAANTAISDLQIGDNVFIWTLSQGGCGEYAADTVVYNVALIPEDFANAGADENLCGRSTINLNASTPTQATGTWTQPMGQTDAGIEIVEINNPSTAITGLTPGEYEFYWSLSEGGCENYSIDTVVINIMDGPMNNAYIAKDEFFACGQEEFTLVAETPSEGTGIWTSNTGALIVNPTNPSTLVADLAVGENWFYWSLSTPGCENYSVDSALIVVHDDLQGVEDLYNIAFNESLESFDVLANDVFGNVENYSFEVITRPSHGALIPLNDEGVFDYVPNANFFGFDTMQYVICNLDCPNACDTVTVSFLVGGTSSADDCFAPNLITPNGDGMNDALMFPCLAGGNFPDNNIMIFNRWGDKVYETAPYNNDWMGTYKGQPLPAGSYYYILMLEEGETPLTGFFTVVR